MIKAKNHVTFLVGLKCKNELAECPQTCWIFNPKRNNDIESAKTNNGPGLTGFSLFDSDTKNVFLFFVLKQITDLPFFVF